MQDACDDRCGRQCVEWRCWRSIQVWRLLPLNAIIIQIDFRYSLWFWSKILTAWWTRDVATKQKLLSLNVFWTTNTNMLSRDCNWINFRYTSLVVRMSHEWIKNLFIMMSTNYSQFDQKQKQKINWKLNLNAIHSFIHSRKCFCPAINSAQRVLSALFVNLSLIWRPRWPQHTPYIFPIHSTNNNNNIVS